LSEKLEAAKYVTDPVTLGLVPSFETNG
jgi:hypothetical protein